MTGSSIHALCQMNSQPQKLMVTPTSCQNKASARIPMERWLTITVVPSVLLPTRGDKKRAQKRHCHCGDLQRLSPRRLALGRRRVSFPPSSRRRSKALLESIIEMSQRAVPALQGDIDNFEF